MVAPTRFYLPEFYAAERELASLLRPFRKIKVDKLDWQAFADGLFDEQAAALEAAATYPILLLYGVPGSGKTTTVRRIVQMFDAVGMTGLVMAPTGKASKRADEVLTQSGVNFRNRPTCVTSFRGLGYNPTNGEFQYNEENPLDVDYLIMDESSFLGALHGRDIFLAVDPTKTRIILVGDPYQLPSVEPGCVFRDMIDSSRFPAANLATPRRQGKDSGIVYNANRILNGNEPSAFDPISGEQFSDWFFTIRDEDSFLSTLVDWVAEKIPAKYGFDPINDIQVLSPGKNGVCGTKSINDALRNALNPGKSQFRDFRKGDKVINRKTSYNLGIYNGDSGRVVECGNHGMTVDFGPGSGLNGTGIVEITGEQADNVILYFAGTIHTSQGSEYPCQITPLYKTHYKLLSRNLLYTAMTRAKKLSMQLGDPKAMLRCVEFSQTLTRMTGLQEYLEALAA